MRTDDIGKGMEQVEMKRMRYRSTIFGFGVPCGAYNGRSTIRRRLIGAWLVLHKARLTFTIPLHPLQSVADKEKTEYLFLSLKGLSEIPFFFILYSESRMDVTKNYRKLQDKKAYKIMTDRMLHIATKLQAFSAEK